MGENDNDKNSQAGQLFENFIQAPTFKGTLQAFHILCRYLDLDPLDHQMFYSMLKSKVNTWKAKALWSKLDKHANHKEYKKGKACSNTQCLVIGAGPCGLRTSIELAFLGCKVVVIEKRETFARNNVLHLWPYTIQDLRSLAAKKFYGKFCAGAIDHISIRQLQLILVKVALLLGVEIQVNVEFVQLLEPSEDQETPRPGWRAEVRPSDHPVSDFTFDVIIGADGRRSSLQGFRRKEFRGKLAIAITANFINRNTTAEAKVEEISGVAFIFNQKFFQDLKEETGIDLENIVYYKDNTHYFVMTAKKQSLLDKGVIVNDYVDTEMLLCSENVNHEALLSYAREAADFATNYQLPALDFAMNHNDQPDVAMFDFTCMYASENAALIRERFGHRLLVALVGDSLLEPFWPMGTGCARGFLAALDTAWMVKRWAENIPSLEILAERESIYRLLPQTTPENINKNFDQYTIDPGTRYPNLNSNCVQPYQVHELYITTDLKNCPLERVNSLRKSIKVSRHESEVRPNRLLTWCQKQTESYKNVAVTDLTSSWKNGLALCAIIHHFCPHLIDFDALNEEDAAKNNQLAFDVAEREFGISPVTTGKEMASVHEPDKLSMVMYLSKFYEYFRGKPRSISSALFRQDSNKMPAPSTRQTNSVFNGVNLLQRKRTPKHEKKNEDSDATSKRRKKTGMLSQEEANPKTDETKSAGNQNKVKSMATQLLAKFEENAPSSSLRRQISVPSCVTKPPLPVSPKGHTNPRFLKPDDQGGAVLCSRKMKSDLVVNAEQVIREAKYIKKVESQAGASKRLNVSPHSAFALTGVLQRLQRLEEKLDQRKALSLAQGDVPFSRKSIKERGAHLTALFGGRTLRQQVPLSDASSSHSLSNTSRSTHDSASSSLSTIAHLADPPTQLRSVKAAAINLEKMFLSSQNQSSSQIKAEAEVSTHDEPRAVVCHSSESKSSQSPNSGQHCPTQMTVGKVSSVIGAMAEILVTLYQTDHRPKGAVTSSDLGSLRRDFPQNLGGSDICYFCKKRVYVMERLSADGKFFHRECFKCEFCSTTLRLGAYAFSVEEGKFYCKPHFTYCKLNSKARKRRNHPTMSTDRKSETGPLNKLDSEALMSAENTCCISSSSDKPPVSLLQSGSVDCKRTKCAPGDFDLCETLATTERHSPQKSPDNLLAIRVMVTSDGSSSEGEREEPCTDPSDHEAMIPSGLGGSLPEAEDKEMRQRHHQPQSKEESQAGQFNPNSKAQEALRRAQSFSAPRNNRQETWRKIIQTKLPLLLRKKIEPAMRETTLNQTNSSESPDHITQVPSVRSPSHLTRGHSLPSWSLWPQKDLKISKLSVRVSPPHVTNNTDIRLTSSELHPAPTSHSTRTAHKLSVWCNSGSEKERQEAVIGACVRTNRITKDENTLISEVSTSSDQETNQAPHPKLTLTGTVGMGDSMLQKPPPLNRQSHHAVERSVHSATQPSQSLDWNSSVTGKATMEGLEETKEVKVIADPVEKIHNTNLDSKNPSETKIESSVLPQPSISTNSDLHSPPKASHVGGSSSPSDHTSGNDSPKSPLSFLVNAFKSFSYGKNPVLPGSVEKTQDKKPKTKWARTLANNSFHGLSLSRFHSFTQGAPSSPQDIEQPSSILPSSPLTNQHMDVSSEPANTPGHRDFHNTSPLSSASEDFSKVTRSEKQQQSTLQKKKDANPRDDISVKSIDSSQIKSEFNSYIQRNNALFSSLRLGSTKAESNEKPVLELDSSMVTGSKNDTWTIFASFKKKSIRRTEMKESLSSVCTTSGSPKLQHVKECNRQPGIQDLQTYTHAIESESESTSDAPSEEMFPLRSQAYQNIRKKRKMRNMALQQMKQEEVKRLHRAQIIQRQLQEVEEKQRVLEERGVLLEKALRGESELNSKEEPQLMQKWFKLVMEKNALVRYEAEMMIFARELELEDQQSQLEQLLRDRMAVDESKKVEKDVAEEKQILDEMTDVIKQRDKLVLLLEEQGLQEKEEDRDLESWLVAKGYKFNWS
ncbi:F-actin-monooxygenase mical2 isoform X1 [Stegostoma tigrinum]|uniref:F-actin-monooxygenase mical2 isoform X1 n=1 Tax=Stegostoma tigrinum TaxID=3053191 RepID=UPI00286FFE2F|nr:F-actin-monooxygenase mical2 isoform X1 [Stegostoma tigrinum]